jgi:hypothetical protein
LANKFIAVVTVVTVVVVVVVVFVVFVVFAVASPVALVAVDALLVRRGARRLDLLPSFFLSFILSCSLSG